MGTTLSRTTTGHLEGLREFALKEGLYKNPMSNILQGKPQFFSFSNMDPQNPKFEISFDKNQNTFGAEIFFVRLHFNNISS